MFLTFVFLLHFTMKQFLTHNIYIFFWGGSSIIFCSSWQFPLKKKKAIFFDLCWKISGINFYTENMLLYIISVSFFLQKSLYHELFFGLKSDRRWANVDNLFLLLLLFVVVLWHLTVFLCIWTRKKPFMTMTNNHVLFKKSYSPKDRCIHLN